MVTHNVVNQGDKRVGTGWQKFFGLPAVATPDPARNIESDGYFAEAQEEKNRPSRWSMGILNDTKTEEVPGRRRPSYTPYDCRFSRCW